MFDFLLGGLVFVVYAATFMASAIFAFSLDTWSKLEDICNLTILHTPVTNPILESNIGWFDRWFIQYHKVVGFILAILSVINLKLGLYVIQALRV